MIKEDFIDNEDIFYSRKIHDSIGNLWHLQVSISNIKELFAYIIFCEGLPGEYNYTLEVIHENPSHTLLFNGLAAFQKNSKTCINLGPVSEMYGQGYVANNTFMLNYSTRPSESFFLDENKPFRKLSKTKMIFCFGNVP
jgi:hypothetical protein